MTPVYLNPPSTSFGTTTTDSIQPPLSDLTQVVDYESKGIPSSSHEREGGDHEESSKRNIYEKRKQRLKQSTMNSNRTQTVYSQPTKLTVKLKGQQCQSQAVDSRNGVRVCTDCNTTTTPLWRGGPLGPKSLCNACGIRQRKAKRAMAAATEASSEEKRWKANHSTQSKKPFKPQDSSTNQSRKQAFFRNVAWNLSRNSSNLDRVFPPDVEEAAILLMELSSGSIYS